MDVLAPGLLFKREDLAADPLGGNKVRALEFLLGGVRSGDRVVTVGAAGSTHALATEFYARRLGAVPLVFRWPQEMNDTAERVSARIGAETSGSSVQRTLVGAYARALVARLRGARWVAAGGSTPLGVLGQVNAGLELAAQVSEGALPRPERIVVPLGTGGTAAGLALGLAIAKVETLVVGVRVVPRVVANAAHVRRLVARTSRLIERLTGESIARPPADSVRIVHEYFGGAYGRVTAAGNAVATRCLELTGIAIDPTYGAKALAAAVAMSEQDGDRGTGRGRGTTLFWLSFDGRWLRSEPRVGASSGLVALT